MKKINFGRSMNINKEKIVDQLVEDRLLREFFIKHDMDTLFIENHLGPLLNYKVEADKCNGCEGLHKCSQDTKGLEPVINFENGSINTNYRMCSFNIRRQELDRQSDRIDSLYMPQMVFNARLDDYDFKRGQNRTVIFNKITNFMTKYLNGDSVKGLYLHGEYQVGKTYTLGALANELSRKNVEVLIAYFPDLVRELKSRIGNGTLEAMISKLKQAEVLMLDDIGGENNSSWVRDEILGPILQHRLLDMKPTFFSSNVSQKDLLKLMTSNSQQAELLKAARIIARIKSLSDEYKM